VSQAPAAAASSNVCPECGGKAARRCRCFRADSTCENGHKWHRCVIHKVIVSGHSNHGSNMLACTCGQGDP